MLVNIMIPMIIEEATRIADDFMMEGEGDKDAKEEPNYNKIIN